MNDLWSEIHSCVSLVEGNDEEMKEFVANLQEIRKNLEVKRSAWPRATYSTKDQDLKLLIGASIPDEIIVQPPKVSKNKGSGEHGSNDKENSSVEPKIGSAKRLKGEKEKAVEQSQKKKRLCRGCGELSHHDIRNCPKKV